MFELRPFDKFLELKEFSIPSDKEVLVKRWQANIQYWAANYLICGAGCLLIGFILAPWSLVFGIIGAACLAYLHTVHTEQSLSLPIAFSAISALPSTSFGNSSSSIPKRNLQIGVGVLTVLLVGFFQGVYFLASLLLAACLVIVHLTFRQRTLASKMSTGFDTAVSLMTDGQPRDPLSIAAAAIAESGSGHAHQQRSLADQQAYQEERKRREQQQREMAEKWGIPRERSADSDRVQRRKPY